MLLPLHAKKLQSRDAGTGQHHMLLQTHMSLWQDASSNLSGPRKQQTNAKPGLDLHQDQLDRLRDYGFNEQEARFLYLAATHSGYFTRHQFLSFTHKTKGCVVHRFTTKLLTQNHAQAIQYGHKTYVFRLTSRKIYDLIGKQDLRDHRSHTSDFIRRRLLVLDFVLSHPDLQYLESQEEKIKFFHEQPDRPASLFLGQTDRESLDPSLSRFFKDRFPFFVSARNGSTPVSALPTFVYCDPAHHGISWFADYLNRHQLFFSRLPAFELIYASPGYWKFDRASQVFTTLFRNANRLDPEHLARYFQIRRLWETRQHGSLTRADRDHLRAGDKQYKGEPFESAYQKWFAAGLSELDLNAFLGPSFLRQEIGFRSHLLPDSYDFLWYKNARRVRPSLQNARSGFRSASRSRAKALQAVATSELSG